MNDEPLFPSGPPAEPDQSSGTAPTESSGSEENLSLMERAILMFSSPDRVFRSLKAHPRWVDSLFFVLVFSLVSSQAVLPLSQQAQRDFMQGMDNMTAEQLERGMARVDGMTTPQGRVVAGLFMMVFLTVWLCIVAGMFIFGGNFLMGGDATYKQALAVTAHAWLPYTALKSVVTVPLMLGKGSLYVATGLAVLLPPEQWNTPIGVLLGAVDVFAIWLIILLASGLATMQGWSRKKGAVLVVSLYAILVLIGMSLSMIFRQFMPS